MAANPRDIIIRPIVTEKTSDMKGQQIHFPSGNGRKQD